MRWIAAAAVPALALVGCGTGGPGAAAPDTRLREGDVEQSAGWERPPEATAEIGALNQDDVAHTFAAAARDLEACRSRGARRLEFLGGKVRFFVKIDSAGRVDHAHLEETTLGDRRTEKCMLRAVQRRSWPKPVGGAHGIARTGFSLDPDDVRPPIEWTPDRVAKVIGRLRGKLGDCGDPAGFSVTLYVGTNGSVLSAGAAPPDEQAEERVDCIVDVVGSAKYPSPGSWPAKVTFTL